MAKKYLQKTPTPAEIAKREAVFKIYRDLGPARSYPKLQIAIADVYGAISARTMNVWSIAHSWKERLIAHDAELAKANASRSVNPDFNPAFDVETALLHSCQIALTRALAANVAPQNPHQLKALIDLAIAGLKAVELFRQGKANAQTLGGGVKRVKEMLDEVEKRVHTLHEASGLRVHPEVIDVEASVVDAGEANLRAIAVEVVVSHEEASDNGDASAGAEAPSAADEVVVAAASTSGRPPADVEVAAQPADSGDQEAEREQASLQVTPQPQHGEESVADQLKRWFGS